MDYMENGHRLVLTDTVKAVTCKMEEYKMVYVKDGRCKLKRPDNFSLVTDIAYIVGVGDVVYPDGVTYDKLPPEPNYEYSGVGLLDSLAPVIHTFNTEDLDHQIRATIKWCEQYGLPFFGNDSVIQRKGGVSSCIKDTGGKYMIGFNFWTFTQDIHHLSDIISQSVYPASVIEETIAEELNFATRSRRETYKFQNHQLVCEMEFPNLLSLAYYQLACSWLAPKEYTFRKCQQCGAIFVTANPKRKYCCIHSPASYRAKTQREKAKGRKDVTAEKC